MWGCGLRLKAEGTVTQSSLFLSMIQADGSWDQPHWFFNFSTLDVDQCFPENLGQLLWGRWFSTSATPENRLASFQNPSASAPAPLNKIRVPRWDHHHHHYYFFGRAPGDCSVQPRLRHSTLGPWLSALVSISLSRCLSPKDTLQLWLLAPIPGISDLSSLGVAQNFYF